MLRGFVPGHQHVDDGQGGEDDKSGSQWTLNRESIEKVSESGIMSITLMKVWLFTRSRRRLHRVFALRRIMKSVRGDIAMQSISKILPNSLKVIQSLSRFAMSTGFSPFKLPPGLRKKILT